MITRFVKLEISEEYIAQFITNFEISKGKIRASEGCLFLELLQDENDPTIFFTHSRWGSEDDLNKYRNSRLFEGIWSVTKPMFCAKPLAWSVNSLNKLD